MILLISILSLVSCLLHLPSAAETRPHIVLVMADDMGWGQTGYSKHPVLKTPNLDSMAAKGLRFDRFYAGGPVCSPTRATVLTGAILAPLLPYGFADPANGAVLCEQVVAALVAKVNLAIASS